MRRYLAVFFATVIWTVAAPQYVAGEILVLSTADTAPFATEEHDGFYDTLLQRAFRRLDIDLEIRRLPSERSLFAAQNGSVDGEYGRIPAIAPLYDNLVIVPEPLTEFHFSAFVRRGTPPPRSFSDLRDYDVAFINGWKIYEERVTDARSVTLADSEAQLFALLSARRVDVILYNRARGRSYLQRNDVDSVVMSADPLAVRPMHLYLNRRHKELVPRVDAVLREMKRDGTYREIYEGAFGYSP